MAMGEMNDRQKAACVGLLFAVFWGVFREAVHAHDSGDKFTPMTQAIKLAPGQLRLRWRRLSPSDASSPRLESVEDRISN
jgi:hypothetical protein